MRNKWRPGFQTLAEKRATHTNSLRNNMGGNNTYNININRAALNGIDVITAIRRYETASGRKYLLGNG